MVELKIVVYADQSRDNILVGIYNKNSITAFCEIPFDSIAEAKEFAESLIGVNSYETEIEE